MAQENEIVELCGRINFSKELETTFTKTINSKTVFTKTASLSTAFAKTIDFNDIYCLEERP